MKICARCGCRIESSYYQYLDNYLQENYFDDPEGKDNCFCSQECAASALTLVEVDQQGEFCL